MALFSFGGLVSGLNTDQLIQQIMAVESRPITFLNRQKTTLQGQVDAFKDLNTRLSTLEDKAFALNQFSNIVGRKASGNQNETLLATANAEATPGNYQIEVLQLASATRRSTAAQAGQGNTLGGIAASANLTGQTVSQVNASGKLNCPLTEGTFSVNGQSFLLTSGTQIDDLLADIGTAIGGTATLVDDPSKGGQILRLTSSDPITVSSGTSNFLSVFNLDTASYSGGELRSSDTVNSLNATAKLSTAQANLAQAAGSGVLNINGTGIAYNANEDSLNDILRRINDTNTGVRASFSSAGGGRITLTRTGLGPEAINLSDTGNLANALGLQGSSSQSLGTSAQIRVDNGPVEFFNSNTVKPAGVSGLTLDLQTAAPGDPVNVTISADSQGLVDKVKDFVSAYNNVSDRISELTRFTSSTNERGALIGDFTTANARDRLRRLTFGVVSGLSGGSSTGDVSELGLSTGPIGSAPGTTNQLQLNETKLRQAVETNPERVAQILGASDTADGSTGIAQRLKNFLDGLSNSTGIYAQKQKASTSQIASIDQRINSLNDRLEARQILLEKRFSGLEISLSRLQKQQSALAGLLNAVNR